MYVKRPALCDEGGAGRNEELNKDADNWLIYVPLWQQRQRMILLF